jgi:hypothetical protein
MLTRAPGVAILLAATLSPAGAGAQPKSAHDPVTTPDLAQARCYGHPAGDLHEGPLSIERFEVSVDPRGPAVGTRVDMEIGNPSEAQIEGVLRLPIPPGAAVVRASLWVDGRPREAPISPGTAESA